MTSWTLGIDTSNYTTSAALFDGRSGENVGRLLDVPEGALGLRQSDALFQHVKRLPGIMEELWGAVPCGAVKAVGASTRPREVEGSYMPCFLAGESTGRCLAGTLGVPFYPCSHQQGHLAAAAWSSGHAELLDRPFLAWHLSGGTTELLHVEPDGVTVHAVCIGGTKDISAGQLIDRTGKILGIPFPAGKGLDALAAQSVLDRPFPVQIRDFSFSLSGMENQVKGMAERGSAPADIARFALLTVAAAVQKTTQMALEQYPGLPVLCSGGVASNSILRSCLKNAVFAPPEYSTDNAMGAAILAHRLWEKEQGA